MKIDDYKSYIVLRAHNRFQTPFAYIYDYNIINYCRCTNHTFVFGTIIIYNETAATFIVEKTKNLLDCHVEPYAPFLGLKYFNHNYSSTICKIDFPDKIDSIKRVVDNMRQFSHASPWRLRVKLRNVVDKFFRQRALDASHLALTL
jgi:hypothetical protein